MEIKNIRAGTPVMQFSQDSSAAPGLQRAWPSEGVEPIPPIQVPLSFPGLSCLSVDI